MASPKAEGETQKCHCGTVLVAHKKEYNKNFPPKLQWQNPDGSAHYQYQANDKTYACVIPKPDEVEANQTTMDAQQAPPATPPPTPPPATAPIASKPEYTKLGDDEAVAILGATEKIFEVERLIKWRLQLSHVNAGIAYTDNPAKVGMYLKLLLDMGVVK